MKRLVLVLAVAVAALGCYPNPTDIANLEAPTVDSAASPDLMVINGDSPDADVGAVDADVPGLDTMATPDGPADLVTPADRAPADAPVDVVPQLGLDAGPDIAADRPDAPPPIARACADYAQNFCARYLSCAKWDLQRIFGNEATCRERVTLSCNLADLPGSNWPTKACADAYLSLSCDNFNNNLQPPACTTPGALSDGAACADETQCQGRRCIVLSGSACGKCGSKRLMDEPCLSDESCVQGLVCPPGTNRVCTTPGGMGASCDATHPCQAQLFCGGSTCSPRGRDNALCVSGRDCDSFNGFGCNGQQGACRAFSTADDCRTMVDGTFHVCFQAGFCKADTFQCLFVAHDGDPCSVDQGPNCLLPAQCVNGRCALPSPKTACP